MKKYLLICIFICSNYYVNSQVLISLIFGDKLNSPDVEFGLEGGVNFSHLGGMESKNSLSTFNLGLYFDIKMKNQWFLYSGVLVKSKLGTDKLSEGDLDFLQADVYPEAGNYSQVLNYFLVPALAKYKLKNHFYVEAGPQFGWMYKSWVEYNSDIDGKDARIREYNKDLVNWFDIGIVGGMGYQLMKGKGMSIGIKYYYGFLDVYKERSGTKNNSLFLKMNIPIGAGKKEKELEKEKAKKLEKELENEKEQ